MLSKMGIALGAGRGMTNGVDRLVTRLRLADVSGHPRRVSDSSGLMNVGFLVEVSPLGGPDRIACRGHGGHL
jgi:hypothetical protein